MSRRREQICRGLAVRQPGVCSRALPPLALLVLLSLSLFVGARTLGAASALLFAAGFGAGPWYPLAKARCYATLPGRSGTVAAVYGLFAPVELATPIIAGALAEHFGIGAGVAFLGTAPLFVLVLLRHASLPRET